MKLVASHGLSSRELICNVIMIVSSALSIKLEKHIGSRATQRWKVNLKKQTHSGKNSLSYLGMNLASILLMCLWRRQIGSVTRDLQRLMLLDRSISTGSRQQAEETSVPSLWFCPLHQYRQYPVVLLAHWTQLPVGHSTVDRNNMPFVVGMNISHTFFIWFYRSQHDR